MKKLLWIGLLALGFCFGWRAFHGSTTTSDGGDPTLMLDRLWIDHLPDNERDNVRAFVALSRQPLGAFETRSRWKGDWEVFRHESKDDGNVRLVFPHSHEHEQVQVRTVRCDSDGFDFCMELHGSSRGTRRYYSRKGWEIGLATTPDALHDQVGHLMTLVEGNTRD